jgi:predicted 3-demethylubiquinone-9 3-methyltransferase (glyoxalase superfamily)
MPLVSTITPCLWFDGQAEEAAHFYVGIFPNSRVTTVCQYGDAGREIHGQPPGRVMVAAFELDGQPFTALNGGPLFRFTEAVSFQVSCDGQEDIDYYWDKLGAGGDASARQCGWLKDRFGLSWQVVPRVMGALLTSAVPGASERVMSALLKMQKLDLAALEAAGAPRRLS